MTDKITLDELVSVFFTSKSFLVKHFKQETGKTIIEYLNDIRIDTAKMLLMTTTKSVEEMLFINSGILHSLNNGLPEPSFGCSVVFHPRILGDLDTVFWKNYAAPLLQDKRLRFQHFSPNIPWQKEFIDHLTTAWDAVACEPADYENEVRYHLTKAISLLLTHYTPFGEVASTHESVAAERTKLMLQYIQAHYSEELTLEQIAASAAVSKSMCLRYFRQIIDTTPIRYLLRYRIEKAAGLLLSTEKRVGEIATVCGFSDISYFTRRFREINGCTPLEYRKENM